MAFPTIDRLGVTNFAGTQPATTAAEFALFKKEYTVDIVKRFNERNIFANRVMKRQISSGTGASFPLTGKTSAQYFVPGVSPELTGTNGMPQAEKTINVDRLLLSDIAVSSVDELMKHVDVRAERSKQQADALARKCDAQLAQLLVLTSRASTIVTGGLTGGYVETANMGTDAAVLEAGIISAVQKLTENDVPLDMEDILTVMKPAQYFLLLSSEKCIDMDYVGGSGTSARRTGKIPTIAGCPIEHSNNFPRTVITATTGELNDYTGDFTKTYGVTFHRSAVGSVQLLDLQFESEYRVSKQNTLFVAKMMVGHGYLRPEAAVELKST